jgi:hypothetical protein
MPTDAFDVRFRVKSRRWVKDGVMPLADLTLSAAMLSRIDARHHRSDGHNRGDLSVHVAQSGLHQPAARDRRAARNRESRLAYR